MGKITMAGNEKALCGLWFDGQKYYEETLPEGCKEESVPVFDETKRWLDIYFSGKIPDFLPPLELHGSDFRIAVWNILLEIPYGQTRLMVRSLTESPGKKDFPECLPKL